MKKIECDLDLKNIISTGKDIFILFHSSWCPFCTTFQPTFKKQAAARSGTFLTVSTDDLPGLEDTFSIEVVPTILFFSKGKLSKRLNGALGLGLSEKKLLDFLEICRSKDKRRKP
ncbi:MAG: hypothetical protein A2234_01935 [Elusimicrobia bacterium RIFOXYA2_FULL_58_8]|nr:MAG: hypothetical protein A2285_04635 [Elusimicrobia bacterium RIFOXYA12_FULL_57_11]OGS12586.1 MAG: hypothetical protein A2234_01935 [Elusimicrobia bacterium RIFOXYA2_FULL_58_8]